MKNAASREKNAPTRILVADFGGTNARAAFASLGARGLRIERLKAGTLGKKQTPADWLKAYYRGAKSPPLLACAACAAGPVQVRGNDRLVRFTNRDAELRASELADACGLDHAILVNDFAAVAHAIPVLRARDRRSIGNGKGVAAQAGAPQLAIGPGTGLGVALRVPTPEGTRPSAVVVPAEGGHAALAPFDRETLSLWPILAEFRDGQLSAEDVICGPGLERLYRAYAALRGIRPDRSLKAVDIAKRGLAQRDELCARSVAVFTRWLGNYAGSLALVAGARGGVFLAGGILPSWGRQLDSVAFRKAFDNQVAMRDYVRAIPVHLMIHDEPALAGLAACAQELAAAG